MKNIGYISLEAEYTRVWVEEPFYENYAPIEWLEQYPGKAGFATGGTVVFFEDPDDATMFMLRWGGK